MRTRNDADDEALLSVLALRLDGRVQFRPDGVAIYRSDEPHPVALLSDATEAVQWLEHAYERWMEARCPA